MSGLASWLLEQVALDESLASGVATDSQGNTWVFSDDGMSATAVITRTIHVGEMVTFPRPPADPTRVLAECEAKRRIVEAYLIAERRVHDDDQMPEGSEWILGRRQGAWYAMQCAATAYADRPGYREEWRP